MKNEKKIPQSPKHVSRKELEKMARAGDDEAFFELIGRDHEYLQDSFALRKIYEWRRDIRTYARYDRGKKSSIIPKDKVNQMQKKINQARNNLLRVGRALAFKDGKDLRGKKWLPPDDDIYYTYRKFISLFRGIRKVYWIILSSRRANINRHVLDFIKRFREESPERFKPICQAIDELENLEGLDELTIPTIMDTKPSDLAIELTAKCSRTSKSTVERALARVGSLNNLLFEQMKPLYAQELEKGNYNDLLELEPRLVLEEFENLEGI